MPRPPEITMLAAPKSGLSETESSSFTWLELPASVALSSATISALPSVATASKPVERTVMTFLLSKL